MEVNGSLQIPATAWAVPQEERVIFLAMRIKPSPQGTHAAFQVLQGPKWPRQAPRA